MFLRSDKATPVNLYQANSLLCSEKKRQGPEAHLSSSKVQVLTERRQISAGSSLKPRPPEPALCHQPKEPGTQPNWPSGSSGHPNWRVWRVGAGPTDCDPGRQQGRRDRNRKRLTTAPRPGLHQWAGALQDTALGPPAHLLPQGQGTDRRAPGRRPGSGPYLTLHLTTGHHYPDRGRDRLINGPSLTAGCLWAWPTAAPANG